MNMEERRQKIIDLENELNKLKEEYFCSFCGKSSHELFCLVAGPSVFICDECIVICADIVAERRKKCAGAISEIAGAADGTKQPPQ